MGLLVSGICLTGSAQTFAFVGARILPITGDPIENGTLLIEGERIQAMGPSDQVVISEGATIRRVEGKTIMPGLVCTHSHIGSVSGGDSSHLIQPDVQVRDSINVRYATLFRARAGGITAANIMSGSGHLLSGQTAYLKLRKGYTIDDLTI